VKQRGGKNLQTLLKGGSRTWFISLTYNPSKDTSVEARDAQVIFGSRGIRTETLTVTQCRARTTYVDAKVTCISRGSLGKANCGVDALREMPDPPANPRESVLDNFGYAFATLDEYMDMLDEVASGRSSNLEYYLADPLTAYSILEDNRADAVLADLTSGFLSAALPCCGIRSGKRHGRESHNGRKYDGRILCACQSIAYDYADQHDVYDCISSAACVCG